MARVDSLALFVVLLLNTVNGAMKARWIVDDTTECNVQRAVLHTFAQTIHSQGVDDVILTSQLACLRSWPDVPEDIGRRLATTLHAFDAHYDGITAHVPGHVIPERLIRLSQFDAAVAAPRFSALVELDLFVVNNSHKDIKLLNEVLSRNPDYEVVSRYRNFCFAPLPQQVSPMGLTSVIDYRFRPWFYRTAPLRVQWLGWVKRSVDLGFLTLPLLEEDLAAQRIRPSLGFEVGALWNADCAIAGHYPDSDLFFTPPPMRVDNARRRYLSSAVFQRRAMVRQASVPKSTASKRARLTTSRLFAVRSYVRHVAKAAFRVVRSRARGLYATSYALFSVILRPTLVKLRLLDRRGDRW